MNSREKSLQVQRRNMTNKVFSPIRGKFLVLHFMPETQEFDANKVELTYLEGLFPG